jgi:beta-lactamase class A
LVTLHPAAADGGDDARPPALPSPATDLPAEPDQPLQQGLEQLVREQGLWGYVESRRLALGLADITDLAAPRYAALNLDHMMYAASLPKIAILLGAYLKIEAGELQLDRQLRGDMEQMIRHSDNPAATRVLERVGRQDLVAILTSERLRLYDPEFNGGLWVGKDYARSGAFLRDPLHHLSHGATVRQVVRFFYLLEKGELVGEPYRGQMKQILADPAIPHKFVAGLKHRPEARLHRKSGTWREFHADAALVEVGDRRYIMVGLGRHADAGAWLARLAGPMHDLVMGSTPVGSRSAAGAAPH